MSTIVVGISAHFHDAACCVLRDGALIAAAQEERFSRVKHDPALPMRAFQYCLDEAGVAIDEIDCIGYYENPTRKLERQLWMGLPELPMASWSTRHLYDATRPERDMRDMLGFEGPIRFFDHHLSHAASSYYFSDFDDAAILTVDAVGEWATTTYGRARGGDIELFEEVEFPGSLGLFYSAITAYLGFEVNDGEYKVMGLAPYGRPRYVEELRKLVRLEDDGQFSLAMEYFDFLRGERMFSAALTELLGHPPREPESELTPFAMDLARSVQAVLEEVLLAKVNYLGQQVDSRNLCLAGGVALNCVAVRRLLRESRFERVFVQPAAGDAGACLGAAALAHRHVTGHPCRRGLAHLYWGPSFSADEIVEMLSDSTIRIEDFRGRGADMIAAVAGRLARGEVIGWFQGRMEFGPRALGARSILADPRLPHMRDRVNELVKKREGFRPFAPAVLQEHAAAHFDDRDPAPFMTRTCRVVSELDLPAVTHVDGSARLQTVDRATAPRFHELLTAFMNLTGCPVLLNTSFNLRGEPIVCEPLDALLCFIRSDLDALVMEDLVIERSSIPARWLERLRPAGAGPTRGVPHDVYTFF